MSDSLGIVTAVLLALLVIVVGVLSFRLSERAQRSSQERGSADADVGSDLSSLLAHLPSTSVVLGPDDEVLRASAPAHALGIIRGGRLAHAELVGLVVEARLEGGSRAVQLSLPRGPAVGSGRFVASVQVVSLTRGRVLILAEDRTAQIRLDDVRRDFIANVSHELKTPVGAIALLAETITDAADDPEAVRTFAESMGRESRRLSGLVQDIIDLSRLQDADVQLEARSVLVDDIVDEAVERAGVEARARDIAIRAGRGGDLAVHGDPALLVTALRNLLDNALRYSEPGTRIAVAVRHGEDDLVEIAVVDQGIGIDPTNLPRVFERFYRVDPARSRQTGGTGLGLSIVKHVAADHGGEVTVWSTPGRGSTFTLRIPAARPTDPSSGEDAPASTADATTGTLVTGRHRTEGPA
ncbi:two-component sensor histidine kinase [Serinibacter arcticus]|uniref:Sensor-like histidine kinase SenX3 n=1 Tax=Serinibacter arcticus TaxID=1655435 RepID=A0A2U1ZUE1_9MICO|nr:ATP-binding protein [Serinibacter arcticus]PWD50595.1 two-component sensor histidine kinase [Serinibacter arcticus]